MFTLFLRALLLYGMMILVVRLLGKRQLGEFQPYELALTILLADIISEPISSVSTPLLNGLLPVAAVMAVNGALSIISMKSDKLRAIISGKPTLVISGGVIRKKELERLCLSLSDLLEGLRSAGFPDPVEVGTAVIEANGSVSAFAKSDQRPPKTSELNIFPGYEGLPMILVMDGRVQPHNLMQAGKDETWLRDQLSARNVSIPEAYLASLDTQGRMTVQRRNGGIVQFQAENPGKAAW